MKLGGWSDDKTFRDHLGLEPDLEGHETRLEVLRFGAWDFLWIL
jgi:hypothetical protein